MEMNVRDVIRMLYVACDGNLDTPFLGVCLSGGEQVMTNTIPSKIDAETGKILEGGTLLGYMKLSIHKSAVCGLEDGKYTPAIAIKRGGSSDVYVPNLKKELGETIEL